MASFSYNLLQLSIILLILYLCLMVSLMSGSIKEGMEAFALCLLLSLVVEAEPTLKLRFEDLLVYFLVYEVEEGCSFISFIPTSKGKEEFFISLCFPTF